MGASEIGEQGNARDGDLQGQAHRGSEEWTVIERAEEEQVLGSLRLPGH